MVLGTAQLGMNYGIANETGQPAVDEAVAIVREAWVNGLTFLDTAKDYHNCEDILGMAIREMKISKDISIISKLSPAHDPCDVDWIAPSVEESLTCLGVECLWGLMLHREAWLKVWDDGLGERLVRLKKEGIVRYIGVSVYSVEGARSAILNPDMDIIQLPCNLWDQRMLEGGVFELARRENKLCFVRSIYLQGLLTMSPEAVKRRLPFAVEAVRRWTGLVMECRCKPDELAMKFALSLESPIVVGVDNVSHMKRNISLMSSEALRQDEIEHIKRSMKDVIGDRIINPVKWSACA
jgi:aryl-alcohol dehydrogenase-like predicted oxidoreductase